MANKRFGPADAKGIKAVDVNLDAFSGVKSRDELKAEKGRIFGHLAAKDQDNAYEELADELGLPKPAPAVTATAPAAPTSPAAKATPTPAQ